MAFISSDRNQKHLLGYHVDDFVPADDKSRFIIRIVSKLDLSQLFARYSSQGGDSFAPDMMLCVWFLAYTLGITSTRVLEQMCRFDLRFIYISSNLKPDHTTLSRFRKRNLDLMADYFVQIVLMAQQSGISEFKEISVDGSKLLASCSKKKSYKEDQLDKKIATLREEISEYMVQCELAEADEHSDIDLQTIRAEKERLEQLEKKLIERKSQLQERKKTLKSEHRKNHQINLTEPEARLMPKSTGPSYNAQIATDSKTNFIAANDVVTDPNDQNQFSPMHQQTELTLGKDKERQYDCDSGFHSLDQLEYIDKETIDAVIAEPTPNSRSHRDKPTPVSTILEAERAVQRSDFTYHKDADYYECPAGDKLEPIKQSKSKSTIYEASKCKTCAIVQFCLPKNNRSGLRRIHRDHREELAEKMYQRLQTDEAKTRLVRRSTTVEPVFGNLKQNLGFRRFNLRGSQQVKGEFNLMCIAHNLNILFALLAKEFFSLFFKVFTLFTHLLRKVYQRTNESIDIQLLLKFRV